MSMSTCTKLYKVNTDTSNIMDIVQYSDSHSEKNGKVLAKSNKFYHNLMEMMEHEESYRFFKKYFQTFDDVKTMLMFIKLYQYIYDNVGNKYVTIEIVDRIVKDPSARHEVAKITTEFIKNKKSVNREIRKLITK